MFFLFLTILVFNGFSSRQAFHWNKVDIPGKGSIFGIEINHELICLVGESGNIIISSEHGVSWSKISTSFFGRLNSAVFLNQRVGIVCGSNGTILKTGDGGRFWMQKHNPESVLSG